MIPRTSGYALKVAAVLIAAVISRPAFGLDPARSLTQYIHRIQQMQQGLPQAAIFSIWQSHDGYLWLGTQRGLARFDGVRFTPLDETGGVSLQDTWVRSLYEDKRGDLWIGTNDAGLIRLSGREMKRFSTPSPSIHCLVPGSHGELWVCTTNGVARIADEKVVALGAAQGLATANIRGICEATDGGVWAGGDSADLSVWDGTRFTPHRLSTLPKQATVRTMLCSSDGAVWVGTTDGLIRLKDGQERRFTTADGLADEWIVSLAQGSGGALWIGTRNGFSRLLNGEFESFRGKNGLSQSMVYSLHEDREGDLWVGTKHGLDQFFDGRTIPFTVNEGLPSNDAGPVFQDRDGTIWVGTLGAGLGRFNGRQFTALTTAQGLSSNTIYALAEDAAGDLWAGTSTGVTRLRKGVVIGSYTTAQGLPANRIRCLYRDSQGELWSGTSRGAAVLRGDRFVAAQEKAPVLAFGEDRDKRLLTATEGGGLGASDGSRLPDLSPGTPPARDVDAIYKDRDGLVWMGTLGGGLRLLKDGKIFSYWMRDGLFDDDIYGIVGDQQDRLWMACSNGIFSVDRSDLLRFAAGAIRKVVSTPYVPSDALRTIECKSGVQPALWRMRDGRLWFSTIRGVIVIDPGRMDHKLAAPQTVIEEVTVNGQREEPSRIQSLLPGEKNLDFRYTGLGFYQPARITFRYRLEGFDKSWINAGTRREALYTNLPPRRYVFRVVACNLDGTCDPVGSSVAFALAPHYYQQAWFLPLCAAFLAVAIWLAYRLRIRRFTAQFDLILGERSRIARELHDTLIQGFSGVTMEMQALRARLTAPEERSTLDEIIQDAARSLQEARRSVAGLRSPHSGLSGAIADAARRLTEAKEIRLKLKLDKGPQGLPAEVEYNLLRIAQEAVANSVRHSGARMVEVSLHSTPSLVTLAVRDDGSGFARNGGAPGHYGLIGMKERAAQIGAGFQVDSEPGRGATVRVLLPVRAES